jgi:hypothetical protein
VFCDNISIAIHYDNVQENKQLAENCNRSYNLLHLNDMKIINDRWGTDACYISETKIP